MSKSALKAAYEKALTLPEAEQGEAADMLRDFVNQRTSALRLSPEQIAEVRRRRADPNPEYATDEEVETFSKRALNED